jgi:hypothetical protein
MANDSMDCCSMDTFTDGNFNAEEFDPDACFEASCRPERSDTITSLESERDIGYAGIQPDMSDEAWETLDGPIAHHPILTAEPSEQKDSAPVIPHRSEDDFASRVEKAAINLVRCKDLKMLHQQPAAQRATEYGHFPMGRPRGYESFIPLPGQDAVRSALRVTDGTTQIGARTNVYATLTVAKEPPAHHTPTNDDTVVVGDDGTYYQGEKPACRGRKRSRKAFLSALKPVTDE